MMTSRHAGFPKQTQPGTKLMVAPSQRRSNNSRPHGEVAIKALQFLAEIFVH